MEIVIVELADPRGVKEFFPRPTDYDVSRAKHAVQFGFDLAEPIEGDLDVQVVGGMVKKAVHECVESSGELDVRGIRGLRVEELPSRPVAIEARARVSVLYVQGPAK